MRVKVWKCPLLKSEALRSLNKRVKAIMKAIAVAADIKNTN